MERLHVHQRRAVAERERARAEAGLSRASTMATELERQLEQANAKAQQSHTSELQGTRAGSRRKKGAVDVDTPGADRAQDQSNSLYAEVMHELDLVKRELRKLQREVKAAREAKAEAERGAETPTPRALTSGSRPVDRVNRDAGEENEDRRGIAGMAEAGGSRKDVQAQDAWTRAQSPQRDTSRASDPEERFATASSSDVGLEPADMAMVPATEEAADHVENGESALTVTRHGEHDDDRSPLQAAAEAELTSARVELESIREEGVRLANSAERTRGETARVAEEIDWLTEQEKRAGAQVQQLNARLLRVRSRLDAAAAADERTEAMLSKLSAAARQLAEEPEAAEKERELAELEHRCVREDAEAVGAEIAAAERRVREAVKELEAARASEAAATGKLEAVVGSATRARAAALSQRSGNVTVPRLEYGYLTGRAEVVRAVADRKVAAAEAWVEALRAGEKEVVMRAEAIERELGEMK